jgi:hypothetical protein
MTPYKIIFGQKPRVNFELQKSLSEQGNSYLEFQYILIKAFLIIKGIEKEEDLPEAVLNQRTVDSDLNPIPNDVQNVDVFDTEKSSISSIVLSNASNSIDSLVSNAIVQLDGVKTGSEETTQCFDEASACNHYFCSLV